MLRIFLASHGHLASGLASSCRVLRGKTENLTTYDAYIEGEDTSVKEQLEQFYQTVQPEDQVLLCSDIYGGSVNQVMFTYLVKPNTRLVTGINIQFLVSVLNTEGNLDDETLNSIIEDSRTYLKRVELEEVTPESADNDFF